MGGTHSLAYNEIARKVWLWCISRKIYLTAAHIPGKTNIQADQASRLFKVLMPRNFTPKFYGFNVKLT